MFGTVVHLELFLENSCGIAHFEKQDVPVLLEQIDGLVTREDGTVLKTVKVMYCATATLL